MVYRVYSGVVTLAIVYAPSRSWYGDGPIDDPIGVVRWSGDRIVFKTSSKEEAR